MVDSAKNILITGGAKGLGAHLARHLSAQGHRILVLDRNAGGDLDPDYRETLTEYITTDLADWPAVRGCIARILAKHEGRIDVLINNAAARSFDYFSSFDTSEIEHCIQVNFKTPVLLAHELLPVMRQNGYGRIINIGSRSAFRPYPSGSLYCSTKSALARCLHRKRRIRACYERKRSHDQRDLPRFLPYARGREATAIRRDAQNHRRDGRQSLELREER